MDEKLDRIARDVVDASMKLHMALGQGLLESVYTVILLKLTGFRLGLLINFGEALLKNGIKRIAN